MNLLESHPTLKLAIISLTLASCAQAVTAGLAASTLSADWCATRTNASDNWERHGVPDFEESNPVLGRQPSTKQVDIYFVGVLTAFSLAQLLPKRYATALNVGTVLVESYYIRQNLMVTPGSLSKKGCGL